MWPIRLGFASKVSHENIHTSYIYGAFPTRGDHISGVFAGRRAGVPNAMRGNQISNGVRFYLIRVSFCFFIFMDARETYFVEFSSAMLSCPQVFELDYPISAQTKMEAEVIVWSHVFLLSMTQLRCWMRWPCIRQKKTAPDILFESSAADSSTPKL